jgi:hypothetical protein
LSPGWLSVACGAGYVARDLIEARQNQEMYMIEPASIRQRAHSPGLQALARFTAIVAALLAASAATAAETVTAGGLSYINHGLAGVGRIPAATRDKFGETFGSGSGLAADLSSWQQSGAGYRGTFYMLPDRGYNIEGTFDYRARLNRLEIVFDPPGDPWMLPVDARQNSVVANLVDTIPLTDNAGAPLTGLDPTDVRPAAGGFPPLPLASNGLVSIDSEALVRLADGGFFIGDEYGPYIYRFSPDGRMFSAIQPPEALLPKRNGRVNFSSNNPGPGASPPEPRQPETGRSNNQGFEGLAVTPGGRFLVAVLQSATRQDSGGGQNREFTRMLYFDLADPERPALVREYVVRLPVYRDADGKRQVAAQSELVALDETRFLLLCRDGGSGYGTDEATSLYRRIEVLDVSQATNIAGGVYDGVTPLAPGGRLVDGIVTAALTPFIDLNDRDQLAKFGLHNGPPNDRNNLSEKWEGMALMPALDPARPRDAYLFVTNDNDFITQKGHQVGSDYRDKSGVDVDTFILVYRLTLPDFAKGP